MIKILVLGSLLFALPAALAAQAAVLPATGSPAAATPNLSGTWNLNIQKSDFGEVPPPDSQTDVIAQSGAMLTLKTSSTGGANPQSYTLTATIGAPASPVPAGTFPADADFQIQAVQAQWQGASLVLDEKISFQGAQGTFHSVLTLSPDGQTLTYQSHISLALGDFDVTYVFDKQ